MSLLDNIKNIVNKYIEQYYNDYINQNKILKIKQENLQDIISRVYEENSKDLKTHIRTKLRDIYKDEYPSGSVENILLDIFQDKNIGINKVVDEISVNQYNNTAIVTIPIINNSLCINIEIKDNYILIKNINISLHSNEICDKIMQYKFIYSINDIILEELSLQQKIDTIKCITTNSRSAKLELYLLLT
tara:strand:+ start:2885 stop:3451 length:567 start_codon:yes stop_codon:yes gene_type:complete